jgi:hypothetical protein
MNVIFSANNRQEVLNLPIVPSDLSWDNPSSNEEFETIQHGKVNLIGLDGLITLSIQSFFPMQDYPFAKSKVKGLECVDFFKRWRAKRVPIRLVVINKAGNELLNIPITVENFIYGLDPSGDIAYTLEIKEFRFFNRKVL